MRRLLPNALVPKFLLVFVPLFLALAAGSFWPLLDYDSKLALDELSARIGNQGARAAAALLRHDALRDPDLTRDLIAPLTVDHAVICADLTWPAPGGGIRKAITGIECEAHHPSGHSLDLPLGDERGTTLSVRFSSEEVRREAGLRRNALFSVLLLATLFAALSAFFGLQLVVRGRLKSLAAALTRIADGGQRVALKTGSPDEIGQILRAFNEMIRREAEREQALEASLEARTEAQEELERVNGELERWIRQGESERRFRDFVASASDWYWEMDAELRFSYFSDRFTEVTGVPAEVLLGKTREETGIPDVDPKAWERHLDDLHSHRLFRGFEHPRRHPCGETVWLSINGTPLFDVDGTFLGYRGTGSEITERIRAKDLAREKEVSEQLARTKGEFLANMSHEIRTPINGVLGMTEVLLKTPLDAKQRRYTENVRRSAEVLLAVVNDILDFSKIEAGKMSLHLVPFDLRELIEDVVEMFAPGAQAKGLDLLADVAADLPRGHRGDPGRLRQVLTNLIGNAIKFTHEGEVVVRLTWTGDGDGASGLRFEVVDTGIGLAKASQAHVFDSFAQADGSTSRNYGGTGLGLAISSQLVGLMGGTIGVDSAPGQGSTFWFTVTLPEEAAAVHALDDGGVVSDARILVVDDSATNREILVHQMAAWGAQPDCAASAGEALTMLRHAAGAGEPYHLAVLDMHMPGMDGVELSRAIAEDPTIAGVRRVVLSSISDALEPETLARAGVSACLAKPVRQRDLRRLLADVHAGAPAAGRGEHPANAVATDRGSRAGRILLAEDNHVNQEVAVAHLDALGLEVDVAADGRAAVDAWSRQPYDLVLMDCQMPRMNGFEAVRAIRALERERGTPATVVVALTANAMEGDREHCLAAGMDDYLSKPFSERQLRALVGRWLPHRRGEAAGPVVDPLALEPFRERERNGRGDLLGRIVRAYLEQSRAQAEVLRRAVAAGDADGVREAAHGLKSSSAQLGARGLAALCADMEQAGRRGELQDVAGTLRAFHALHARVCEELATHCQDRAA